MTKNKRGDVPVTILVIGVVVICILTVFSFVIFENKNKNFFDSVQVVEKINSDIEKYYFYENADLSLTVSQIMDFIGARAEFGEIIFEEDSGKIRVEYRFES